MEDAQKDGAPQVGRGSQRNVEPSGRRRRGDSDKRAATYTERTAGADHRVAGRFTTEVQTHTCLETHGTVCSWEGEDLLCYASTQATFNVAREMSSERGAVRANSTHVICEYVGGGFGSKFSAGREGITAALLARDSGRPVHLMLDRREEHTSVGNRPNSNQEMEMAVKNDGTILGVRIRSTGTAGSGSRGGGAQNDAFYNLGFVDKIAQTVRTNTGAQRAMRAPGWPQGIFALESLMDMAAEAIKIDPVEFRLMNDNHKIRPEEFRIGAKLAGWKRKRKAKSRRGPLRTGIGCAGSQWAARGGRGAGFTVRIHRNGTVETRNGSQDLGTGARTITGMVVAEELGIGMDRIKTFIGDTRDPRGPASGGSTTTPTLTPVARLAGFRAKEQLLEMVAAEYKWNAADLDLRDGLVIKKGGKKAPRRVTFAEACALMEDDLIEVTEQRRSNTRNGFSSTNAGCQFAEVEVDIETGKVHVTRVVAVQDAGKIINPLLARSQVRGGVIQGVSYALYERRIMDRQEGRMINADLESYKVIGPKEMPEIDVHFPDVLNGYNNTSTMGIGEPPVISTAAAIANAVAHAIGVRVMSLPITPRKVLEALAAKEKK
jgi:xanthine dehydrogenase YagR molybdenum-binding subunit